MTNLYIIPILTQTIIMNTLNKRLLPSLFILLATFSQVLSQQGDISVIEQHKKYKAISYPDIKMDRNTFFSQCKQDMGFSAGTRIELDARSEDKTPLNHYKYRQYYKDIPVLGGTYILHTNDADEVVYANGYYLPEVNVNTKPSITISEAEQKAKTAFAKEINYDNSIRNPHNETHEIEYDTDYAFDDLKILSSELIIMNKDFPNFSDDYHLCYRVEVKRYTHEKLAYMIDAHNGDIVSSLPLVMHQSVQGEGQTKYYGIQPIIIDSIRSNLYQLIDDTRGKGGNMVLDENMIIYQNDSKFWDLTNSKMDEVAIDAHHCTERFYDLLLDEMDWAGLDGDGRAMSCVLHSNNYGPVNAYWDGDYSYFGDGDCHRGPLTTYEVVAHEFQHGVTGSTSALVYRNESGAINESLSDIMGKALEYEEDPDNFNWYIGASFILTDKVEPFRNMEDPTTSRNPGFYKGEHWRDGGGVHSNSGVGNRWFYILTEGESGINDNGDEYNCSGIGMKDASKIAFNTNAFYLTESSDYNAFYRNSVQVAEELFGKDSDHVIQVKEAWLAVGLPYGNPIENLDLTVIPKAEEFIISTCTDNEFYDIEFYVLNVGTVDYLPSMGGIIDMPIQGFTDTEYLIDETIPAGDSILVSIPNFLRLSDTRDYVVFLNLELVDNNLNNNRDRIYISNTLDQIPNFNVVVSSPFGECGDDSNSISYQLRNEGCTHPQEEPIYITVTTLTGEVIYTRTINLTRDFGQNLTSIYFANIDLSENESTYILNVDVESDANFDDNEVEFQVTSTESIAEEFKNTFDSSDDLGGKTRSYVPFGSQAGNPIVDFQGDSYFAASAFSTFVSSEACPGGAEEIFNNDPFGFYPYVEFCVDATSFTQPMLSFDLIQFQNQELENWDEIEDVTTMVRLTYTGTSEDTLIITAQPEGTLVEHLYEIPANFMGAIKLEFYSLTGVFYDNPNFLNYDVHLIDDIHIFDRIDVSTTDNLLSDVKVYPNPSINQFYIESDIEIINYKVTNTLGATQKILSSGNTINLNNLADGYYFLTMDLDDGTQVVERLMKISE